MNQLIKKSYLLLALSIAVWTPLHAGSHDQSEEVKIVPTKVGDGLYMLTGQGGNIGLSVGDDGVFMIDDQFAPLTQKIKAAIKQISDKPVRFLINTHWHFDHTGGNENLGNDGVVIVAHENVRKRMSKDGFIKAFNKKVPAAPAIALPVITFKDNIKFHLNNHEIKVLHQSNAHTDGDSIIFFKKANVIHMGDIFFNKMYPFMDASSEGAVNGMIRSVEMVLNLSDNETVIIPGHGPLANKKDLQAFHHMLTTVTKRMQKLINQGKSVEEIVAMKPNADFDQEWGNGFLKPDSFVNVLHSVMPGK